MQTATEIVGQNPWLARYCQRGKVTVRGVSAGGCLDVDAPDLHFWDTIDTVVIRELKVLSNDDIFWKMLAIRNHQEDLQAKENFLDQAWFVREDGQEIAFYEACGNGGPCYGTWDQNTRPTPWDGEWSNAVDWIVCEITKSAEEWTKHYLIVYRVIR